MSETNLYAEILREYSHSQCRLFRQNAGFAWQGRVLEQTPQRLILANPRPIRMGVPGLSDLGGWVTSNFGVYGAVAQYLAIEGKSAKGRLTPAQAAFLELVRRAGGRAGVARSVEDARAIIHGEI